MLSTCSHHGTIKYSMELISLFQTYILVHRPSHMTDVTNKTKFKIVYILSWCCWCFFPFPPLAIMSFACSFCPKLFASETDLSQHMSGCSKKISCIVSLPSGPVKAYRNPTNQWPCYCNLTKCNRKIYTTAKSLQQHIRRDAKIDTQWKVFFDLIM